MVALASRFNLAGSAAEERKIDRKADRILDK
jgi:hypothetical protein